MQSCTRNQRIILNSLPFAIAALIFIFVRLSIRNPLLVENYYSEAIYPFIAKLFSSLSNIVPFSLWDIFWILIILLVLYGLILVLFSRIRFGWYVLRVAQAIALLYSLFYLSWGFNYFRPDIEARVGWKSPKADSLIFRSILDSLIVNTNASYTNLSSSEYSEIDRLVEESYSANRSELGIDYPNGRRRPKKMTFSFFFAKTGISGYFGPFFNEVHINRKLLPMDYPFLLAHEKAHQFGITSEAEANLAAFIICSTSDDMRLNYSGNLFVLLYFLNDATKMKDYHEFIKKIDRRVVEDVRFRGKYYDGLQNKTLEKVQSKANDVYLKSNHIKHVVMNYNEVVALVISWYGRSSEMDMK
jgi:hypothetical protein